MAVSPTASWSDFHFADVPSLSLLKRLKVYRGVQQQDGSLADGGHHPRDLRGDGRGRRRE